MYVYPFHSLLSLFVFIYQKKNRWRRTFFLYLDDWLIICFRLNIIIIINSVFESISISYPDSSDIVIAKSYKHNILL